MTSKIDLNNRLNLQEIYRNYENNYYNQFSWSFSVKLYKVQETEKS